MACTRCGYSSTETLCGECRTQDAVEYARRDERARDRARIAQAIRDVITKSDWPERPHRLLPRLLRVVEGGA